MGVGRPGPYSEVLLLSSSVQGSCWPYPPFPHLLEQSEPELPTSPVLSLGDKAGRAHNQPASTNSYIAFKTRLQVVSSIKPPLTEEAIWP